jgi:hypothetical protein
MDFMIDTFCAGKFVNKIHDLEPVVVMKQIKLRSFSNTFV